MASPRNPRPVGLASVDVLPESPHAGQLVRHTDANVGLTWDGTRWVCLHPGTFAHPDPGGLAVRKAVTLVDGVLVLCDPLVHSRVDGVVSAVFDGLALRTALGDVDGYEGLTPNEKVYVTSTSDLTHESFPNQTNLLVGHATTATKIMVAISEASASGALDSLTVDRLTVHELEAGILNNAPDDNAEHLLHGRTVVDGASDTIVLSILERAEVLDLLSVARLAVGLTSAPDPAADDPYVGHSGDTEDPYPDIYTGPNDSPPERTGLTVDEAGNLRTSGWLLVKHAPEGIVLRAPNGLYYGFRVDAGGAISTTGRLVGPTPP